MLLIHLLRLRTGYGVVVRHRVPRGDVVLRRGSGTSLTNERVVSRSSISSSLATIQLLRANSRARGHDFSTSTKPRGASRLPLFSAGTCIVEYLMVPVYFVSVFWLGMRHLFPPFLCTPRRFLQSRKSPPKSPKSGGPRVPRRAKVHCGRFPRRTRICLFFRKSIQAMQARLRALP